MKIPFDSYETGELTVLAKDEFEAMDAVRNYHADRTICLAKQKKQFLYRFVFVIAMLPLILEPCYTYFKLREERILCFLAIGLALVTFVCVMFLKRLYIPAVCSLVFLVQVFREDVMGLLFCVLFPVGICCALAYVYERDRRYLRKSPGYPDFHPITLHVLREESRPGSLDPVPEEPEEPADDPYADILSPLQ